MSVLNLSSLRPPSDAGLEELGQLAVTLSARLTRSHAEETAAIIANALAQIVEVMRCSRCRVIEFDPAGCVACVHLARTTGREGSADCATCDERWLTDRLTRGDVVTMADSLPGGTAASMMRAPRPGAFVAVPARIAGQTVCALVVESATAQRRWPQALIERLQLLAELIGATLQRARHEVVLRANVSTIEQLNARLEADNTYLKEEIKAHHDFDDIVGDSAPLRLALSRLAQVAPTNSTVLLTGPTGAGKELFARAVHERSRRRARPLVRVNCAALPPTLVESELFGHEKGAFTGAVALRQGRFELADGGTIFLDEIGDLTPDIQVKFLRVLQEGEFERVGSSRTTRVDVRLIAATHHDLQMAVAEGRFRADLYYRLSVYPIRLPSLHERADDVPRLVWYFIHRHQRELGRQITKVPQSVMQALQDHAWPGNVRELENVVERAMIRSEGDTLYLDDPLTVVRKNGPAPDVPDNLDAVQRQHIEAVLERCRWRINGAGNAAERLGIHPNTLRFRMKKLGIAVPRQLRHHLPSTPTN